MRYFESPMLCYLFAKQINFDFKKINGQIILDCYFIGVIFGHYISSVTAIKIRNRSSFKIKTELRLAVTSLKPNVHEPYISNKQEQMSQTKNM